MTGEMWTDAGPGIGSRQWVWVLRSGWEGVKTWHEGKGGSSGKYSLIWPREGRHDFYDEPLPSLSLVRKEDGIVLLVCTEYSPPANKQMVVETYRSRCVPFVTACCTIITASTDPFRRWQSAKSLLQPISNFLLGRGSPINHPRPIHTDIHPAYPLPHHLATTAQRTLPPFPYRARHDPGLCFDSPTPPPPIQTDKKKQETAP